MLNVENMGYGQTKTSTRKFWLSSKATHAKDASASPLHEPVNLDDVAAERLPRGKRDVVVAHEVPGERGTDAALRCPALGRSCRRLGQRRACRR